jgi:hydroxymethylpyrimidine/phosphomethylpyrimidine kinase
MDSKITYSKPCVLSIAGYDPCGGAGVLADVKTFETHDVLGFAVATSITIQNENEFNNVYWLTFQQIKEQIEILFKIYTIDVVKIGLVENIDVLNSIIDVLFSVNKNVKIIWDPILKSSTGFNFHTNLNAQTFNNVMSKIYLITPNLMEAQHLFQINNAEQLMNKGFGENVNILIKGGHSENDNANDVLIYPHKIKIFESKKIVNAQKHGSGCVLSAAIAANLANRQTIEQACENAKLFITNFLKSNNNLLGYYQK